MNEREIFKARRRLWMMGEHAYGLDATRARARGVVVADAVVAAGPVESAAGEARQTVVDVTSLIMPDAGDAPFSAPLLSLEDRRARLLAMDSIEVSPCTRCPLCQTRTKTVFGEGDPAATIFFIGEGPGETEDLSGRPFVGRAGQLLEKMIGGMGLTREQVFIANLVKCRPPANRVPTPVEVATCTPYLVRQLEIVRPRVIVTLGLPAAQYMLNVRTAMGKMRGQWQQWRGIQLMPTYHPAYLLRAYTEANRKAVWEDLKQVMGAVGLGVSGSKAKNV